MRALSLTYLMACLALIFAPLVQAETICTRGKDCPTATGWKVGIAVGLGASTNPLVDGDALPQIVLPDIAYYGEAFYFDNGELGWRSQVDDKHSMHFFVSPNRQKGFFSFWHPSNIFVDLRFGNVPPPSQGEGNDIPGPLPTVPDNDVQVSVDDVSSRDWAIDGGIRWQWRTGSSIVSASWHHDLTGVYEGAHASISLVSQWQIRDWTVYTSPRIIWHSNKLTDYYYGIDEPELVEQGLMFTGKGGLQYGLQVMASKPVSENWRLLIRVGYTKLHSGMANSPLVERTNLTNGFVGMAYRF